MRLAFLDKQDATQEETIDRLKALRRFADDRLKPDLEAVEGSAAVKVSGGYEDEVQVFVDQQKLAQLGLSIDAVTRRIRADAAVMQPRIIALTANVMTEDSSACAEAGMDDFLAKPLQPDELQRRLEAVARRLQAG